MSPQESSWSREDVEQLLQEHDFRYQNVDLPYGLSTGGYDRSPTADLIFPDDLTGKSVLDIGCCFGFFSFEAIKRGARRVVGLDIDPDSVRKARLLGECLGSPAEFQCRDIELEPLDEDFDYILGLNILHHMRNPLALLDHLTRRANEQLILEVATIGSHDRRKVGISRLARGIISKLPVIFPTRSGTRGRREIQRFYMTQAAIENLLVYQRGHFARLDVLKSPHKDRFVAIAHKRRIDHLLVVSGPTSAGKKTLMRRLRQNELPELAEKIGVPDGSAWGEPKNASRIFEPDTPHRERMLLHHDFLRPYLRSTVTHQRDEANDLFECARRVTFVTVWTPAERLRKQITQAEIEKARAAGKKPKKRHLKIAKEYEDPSRVAEHYRRWFDYTATVSEEHIVVDFENGFRMRDVDTWRAEEGAEAPSR
ncbi:MAG TPA: methyltransferase domain-containing protein [Planctomycetes bacterium]|nr:methyltransferase domain-containing protein [Planctomycetota bacterium]